MMTGSEFGRRARQEDRGAGVGRERGRPAQSAATQAPVEEAGDPLPQALQYAVWAAGALIVAVAALVLFMPSSPQVTPTAKPRPAPAPAVSAPARGAAALRPADEPEIPSGQAAVGAGDEQREAALKFLGFYHLNTRVRSTYCGNLGVDMEVFSSKFRQTQVGAHARAIAIMKADGKSEEQVFSGSRAELEGLIGGDLEKIGRQVGTGERGACEMMVKFADRIVPGIDFKKVMPDAHRALMGS